eukprot:scaffold23078_cov32-Tisochrysis_lutea.AAC.2
MASLAASDPSTHERRTLASSVRLRPELVISGSSSVAVGGGTRAEYSMRAVALPLVAFIRLEGGSRRVRCISTEPWYPNLPTSLPPSVTPTARRATSTNAKVRIHTAATSIWRIIRRNAGKQELEAPVGPPAAGAGKQKMARLVLSKHPSVFLWSRWRVATPYKTTSRATSIQNTHAMMAAVTTGWMDGVAPGTLQRGKGGVERCPVRPVARSHVAEEARVAYKACSRYYGCKQQHGGRNDEPLRGLAQREEDIAGVAAHSIDFAERLVRTR